MKEAYYFSHDSNARHDPKITAMRGVYGAQGYGWFWMLVEMMREADGYRLDMKSKYAFNAYAMQLQSESNAIASFVHDCINEFQLFQSDGEHFWTESLLRRMKDKEVKSEKARESANARWKNRKENANALEEDANAPKNDALKESKVKEIKEKIKTLYGDHVQMTEDQHQKLIGEFGQEITTDFIDRINYWFSQKPERKKNYKDHYLMVRKWKREDDKRKADLPSNKEAETQQRLAEERKREHIPIFKPDPILGATGT